MIVLIQSRAAHRESFPSQIVHPLATCDPRSVRSSRKTTLQVRDSIEYRRAVLFAQHPLGQLSKSSWEEYSSRYADEEDNRMAGYVWLRRCTLGGRAGRTKE